MKAIVCQTPDNLEIAELDIPNPAPREALLKVRRVGICGTDLHAFKGNQPFFTYPRILGHELAGEVESISGEASGLGAGDPVAVIPYLECGHCIACRSGRTNCCANMNVLGVHSEGGMREYICVPTDHLIRAYGLDWDQIALVECFAIGAHAVRRADTRPGENALVIGAGPIGLGALQMARVAGARVIAMDISESRLAYCKTELGIEDTILADSDAVSRLKDLTNGDFPTLVFDATGNAASMKKAVEYLSHTGRLVYIGLVKGDISIDDPEFHRRETTLLSSRNATREDFSNVMAALRAGTVTTSGIVTHRSSLSDLPNQLDAWTLPDSGVIKAVVDVA